MLESWTTISVLAGVTSKIKLGTMMTGIIYRYPSILAKIGATLDVLSKGRLFMGIGAWNEEESLAVQVTSTQFFLQKSNRSPRTIRWSVLSNLEPIPKMADKHIA